jgi:hypothetical protein
MVTPEPDNELVQSRTPAATDLVQKITDSKTYDLLLAATTAAANGLDGFKQDSELVQTVVGCIREHQPAFPEDLTENALDLRACCAVAVGEILSRDVATDSRPDTDAQLVASLMVPGTELRPRTNERYLQLVLDELHDAAIATLQRGATVKRQRVVLSLKKLESFKVPPLADQASAITGAIFDERLAAFWKGLFPLLRDSFSRIQQQASADREELEILWWLYDGFSANRGEGLRTLKPAIAAAYCGVEMADRATVPVLSSIREMVVQATTKHRPSTEIEPKTLEELIGDWDAQVSALIVPQNATVRDLVRNYPSLLPLSWLCWRLNETNHSPGWNADFEARSSVRLSGLYAPADLAVQVFNERAAQKFYEGLVTS